MLFICSPPKFSFSWELKWPKEKLKTMLMQILGVTSKEHSGILWYFWSRQWQFMHTLTNPTIPHIVLFHVWFAYLGKCPSPKTSRLCHMGLKNLCSNDTECNYIDGGVCCFDGCRRRCATSDSFPDRLESKISDRFYFVVISIDIIILQLTWLMSFQRYSTSLNSRLPCGR